MTTQDKAAFSSLMGDVCAAFRCEITESLLQSYFRHLSDFDISLVSRAISKSIKSCDRFPTIKAIREMVYEIKLTTVSPERQAAIRRTIKELEQCN